MTYLGALLVGVLVHRLTSHWWQADRALGAGASAALIAALPASVAILTPGWTWVLLRERRDRLVRPDTRAGLDHLGQVLYVALSAGLPVAAALEFAAGEVGPAEASAVRSVLRAARNQGLAFALAVADGPAAQLFAALARAQVTGSSAIKTVASFVEEERRDRRARAAEAAQRLPVKLTVPLALLILPGFVLLTIGPTVIATVHRLLGPLLS